MQTIYFVLLMISIGYVFFLLSRFQKHISVYYILMTVAVVIVNLGYLQMAICNLCPFFFSVCNIFSEKEFENSTDKRLDEE